MPRSDDRFARQDRCRPPPEFPLASPCPGIVHHLSGTHARARAPPRRRRRLEAGRWCARPTWGQDPTSADPRQPSLSLRRGVSLDPLTRACVRLLGPCFKTGRVDHRPTRRRRAPLPQRRGASRAGTGMGPSQGQPGHRGVPVRGGTVPPTRAFDSPATGRGDLLRGKYARGGPRDEGGALRSPTPRLRTPSGLNPPVRPSRFHPFSS